MYTLVRIGKKMVFIPRVPTGLQRRRQRHSHVSRLGIIYATKSRLCVAIFQLSVEKEVVQTTEERQRWSEGKNIDPFDAYVCSIETYFRAINKLPIKANSNVFHRVQ